LQSLFASPLPNARIAIMFAIDCNRVCNWLQSCLQSIAIMLELFMQAFLCAKHWWCQQTDHVGSRSMSVKPIDCVGNKSSAIWQAAPAMESACCWLLPMAAAISLLPWHPLNRLKCLPL
jgi:hypothetical protein